MIVIQSFFANDTSNIRSNIELVSKQAELSNKFLKKHKYNTILYTDINSIDFFKHINYDDIQIIKLEDHDLPDKFSFWSITKLLCCLLTNEPFLHIDFDFFLVEDIIKPYIDQQFVSLHHERWMKKCFFKKLCKDTVKQYFDIDTEFAQSYNFGVFGGLNNHIIKNNMSKLINRIKIYDNQIKELLVEIPDGGYNWKQSVFLEQYILPSMIAKDLGVNELPVLIPESIDATGQIGIRCMLRDRKIIHIWTLKDTLEEFIGINLFLDMIDKYYF